MNWTPVCLLDEIIPGTGVCALVGSEQIAVFRPSTQDSIFALSNIDPFFQASVLSRGLIAEHKGELWVASPLKKQRFALRDGRCMESEEHSIRAYPARINNGFVEIGAPA